MFWDWVEQVSELARRRWRADKKIKCGTVVLWSKLGKEYEPLRCVWAALAVHRRIHHRECIKSPIQLLLFSFPITCAVLISKNTNCQVDMSVLKIEASTIHERRDSPSPKQAIRWSDVFVSRPSYFTKSALAIAMYLQDLEDLLHAFLDVLAR